MDSTMLTRFRFRIYSIVVTFFLMWVRGPRSLISRLIFALLGSIFLVFTRVVVEIIVHLSLINICDTTFAGVIAPPKISLWPLYRSLLLLVYFSQIFLDGKKTSDSIIIKVVVSLTGSSTSLSLVIHMLNAHQPLFLFFFWFLRY